MHNAKFMVPLLTLAADWVKIGSQVDLRWPSQATHIEFASWTLKQNNSKKSSRGGLVGLGINFLIQYIVALCEGWIESCLRIYKYGPYYMVANAPAVNIPAVYKLIGLWYDPMVYPGCQRYFPKVNVLIKIRDSMIFNFLII